MAITHKLVTLNSTTPTLLTDAPSASDFYERIVTISIQNLDSTHYIFVGAVGVSTSSYGYRIDPGNTLAFQDLGPDDDVYAVSDSGTPQVGILKVVE